MENEKKKPNAVVKFLKKHRDAILITTGFVGGFVAGVSCKVVIYQKSKTNPVVIRVVHF